MLLRSTIRATALLLVSLAGVLPACRYSSGTTAPPHVESAALTSFPPVVSVAVIVDRYPGGEVTISGTCSGSYLATHRADGATQVISEGVEISGGDQGLYSSLDHRWRLRVAGGRRLELHVSGHRNLSLDGDDFAFELSSDGGLTWTPVPMPSLSLGPPAAIRVAALPPDLSGEILVRVVDTRREPGLLVYDTIYVDEIFVRSIS